MSFDMYSENILDHYKYPDHKGEVAGANAKASDANVTCGDKITFELKIVDAPQNLEKGQKTKKSEKSVGSRNKEQTNPDKWAGLVQKAGFSGVGCAISQASADILAEMLQNKTVKDALALSRDDVLNA